MAAGTATVKVAFDIKGQHGDTARAALREYRARTNQFPNE